MTGTLAVYVIAFFSGDLVLLNRSRVDNFVKIIKIATNLINTLFPLRVLLLVNLFASSKIPNFWWKMLMPLQQNLEPFQMIYIFSGSSSITEPWIIIMEYVWQILAERYLFATSSFSSIHLWAFPNYTHPEISQNNCADSKLLGTISLQNIMII